MPTLSDQRAALIAWAALLVTLALMVAASVR